MVGGRYGCRIIGAKTERLENAIVESSNDATGLLVDVLTGTTSGPELPSNPS